ncbi:bifunctional dihydroneopterin aldolase/dihydroneopterin triphosphate 2'-epimerase [Aquimixticola soesokkakensis]|uniref:Bifunctional dihydroneopterin aldolase/dihydroneopterin triphosphate 2'-epimerase n=1 Tax=Aquimixticola soesokkakensis TaxID=1519096 RepID=A0A1Y5S304_9RHOB|nr:dihydroneopterin aldolase [Aquimixticola soesokkakensis]SLN31163.1 bifunctional dihydroneopterin aldolase/dihydroneopterin triphosphate 2'-epimerase [Aquimixticola soesokkakensis]
MSSDIGHAFDHPEARAAATAGSARHDAPFDRISLRDHMLEVEIGAFQAERGVNQRINFNVVVEVTPDTGPVEDDVDRILSYDRITEAIHFETHAERLALLETLAERIAARILAEPRAFRVFVRIEKLDRGPGALGVEIVRTKGASATPAQIIAPAPRPLVVYLDNVAIASPHLSGWLDALAHDPRPVILTVGLPDGPRPQVQASAAQRRIDLLAIEQNAWRLGARDPRAVVRATRTELDWAMKTGQLSVWAPSKIVLDTPHGPHGAPLDLVTWFAREEKATELLILGQDTGAKSAPQDTQVPRRSLPLSAHLDLAAQAL